MYLSIMANLSRRISKPNTIFEPLDLVVEGPDGGIPGPSVVGKVLAQTVVST